MIVNECECVLGAAAECRHLANRLDELAHRKADAETTLQLGVVRHKIMKVCQNLQGEIERRARPPFRIK
jgi:hypothetical protein